MKASPRAISVAAISAALLCLLLALVKFNAYWPYQLSRWGLCGAAAWIAWQCPNWRRAVCIVLAVIYNPLQPVSFDDLWPKVNAGSAAAFLVTTPILAFRGSWGDRRATSIYFLRWILFAAMVLLPWSAWTIGLGLLLALALLPEDSDESKRLERRKEARTAGMWLIGILAASVLAYAASVYYRKEEGVKAGPVKKLEPPVLDSRTAWPRDTVDAFRAKFARMSPSLQAKARQLKWTFPMVQSFVSASDGETWISERAFFGRD